MNRISIIVPAYNAEQYIEKCLESILKQDYQNKEIIVVNDGSTDKTEEKIQKYMDKIIYIKKENGGLSDARNTGIANATGKYLMFVDSDDYIENDLLLKLEKYINQNIDLIKFKAKKITGENIELLDGPVTNVLKGDIAFSQICFNDKLLEPACLYLYKKDFWDSNKFEFSTGLYHEDFGLVPLAIVKANTFISTDIFGYNYVQSPDSITRTEDYNKIKKKAYDLLKHYDNIVELIEKYDIHEKAKQDLKIYCTNCILLRINDLNKDDKKSYINEIKNRKMQKNIVTKNLKQLIKRVVLEINIPLYLKMR